ncbi:MAG: glutathionylspermidine synthase family protein [Proteobacteria bacterium]|nr:glutathionylspermidine synthase family protein [Pseudomonadota bacterium]
MKRIPATERPDLAQAAVEHGFEFKPGEGVTGWDESAYYQFSLRQIEEDIEAPVEELEALCFDVVDRAVNDEAVMGRLGIPELFWGYIRESWHKGEKNLCGRMDLSYDGTGPAKLLEYNADTPTGLYESAVFQWEWLEAASRIDLIPSASDQYNDIHESLVQGFSLMGIQGLAHFACNQDIEDDKGTLDYLEECAKEAGLETCFVAMSDIGTDELGRFTDLDDRAIMDLIKLYPWEWIMDEEFGAKLLDSGVRFVEPPWKAILSNKGLMPLMWDMFEGHPNLLPAYFEDDPGAEALGDTYVRKPLLSRQGANIEIVQDGKTILKSDGPYGAEDFILQGYHPLPDHGGKFPLLGCWLVASKAVGICIREDQSLITGENCQVVPHVILD